MEEKYLVPLALLSHKSLSTVLLWRFHVVGNNKTYLNLHVNWPILTKLDRLKNVPAIKFNESPTAGSQRDTCGQTANDEANSRFSDLCESA